MPEILQAQPLGFPDTDALRFLPEGPIAVGESRFSWVGIQHGADQKTGSLNLFDLSNHRHQSFDLPGRPGFAFPTQQEGVFVVGCERSLGWFDLHNRDWQPFCDGIDSDVTGTIINDAVAVEDNLIFGTKDLEFSTQKAGLYLYRGRDQQLIRLRADQICSNGKAVQRERDGRLMLIDIDSPTRKIVRYEIDLAAGSLSEPTVLIDLEGENGVPDGAILTPDGDGIIVSLYHPGFAEHGETRQYNLSNGELTRLWQTPGSPQNTCPALVPHQGRMHLVITTAVENMSAGDRQRCPNAGQIFIAPTDWEATAVSPDDRYPK